MLINCSLEFTDVVVMFLNSSFSCEMTIRLMVGFIDNPKI